MAPEPKIRCSHCGQLRTVRTVKNHLRKNVSGRARRSTSSNSTPPPPSPKKSARQTSRQSRTRRRSTPLPRIPPRSSPVAPPPHFDDPSPTPPPPIFARQPVRLARVPIPDSNDDDDDDDDEDEDEVGSETEDDFLLVDPDDDDGKQWLKDREERWNQGLFDAVASGGLSERDLTILRQFQLVHRHGLSRECWNEHQYSFPNDPFFTIPELRSRVQHLAGFKPVIYDCCRLSCVLYVGPWADCDTCPNPKCKLPRRRPNGSPYKTFSYLPLIPQLSALFSSPEVVELLRYRAHYTRNSTNVDSDSDSDPIRDKSSPPTTSVPDSFISPEKGKVKDVFDGSYYCELCRSTMTVDGQSTGRPFFADDRDIALGLSTDGFSPFKRRKHSAWPLIIFIYNLPPSLRFLLEWIICIGVIPGPKAPWDLDSYVIPAIEELEKLGSEGVSVYDSHAREMFDLRAHLIELFGDMPAVAKMMRMKGAVAIKPCRTCDIVGVRIPGSSATTHYTPLDRSRHPDPGDVLVYDPTDLPLRQHEDYVEQAQEVEGATTHAERDRLRTAYGINGISSFLRLPSVTFPTSMPLDFMHLIWENLVKNLVTGLWAGDWKGLDHSDYALAPSAWAKIGKAILDSGSTIPASLGARIPDFVARPSEMTAETWSFLFLYLLPIVLRDQLSRVYYDHFMELVSLLKLCISFSITDKDVNTIEDGFVEWVQAYERLYYRGDPQRAGVCPVTVHALLHIAQDIRQHGPVWTHWAYPMERFCGVVGRAVHSKRYPWAEIDNFVKHRAQMRMIALKYQLGDTLNFALQHRQRTAVMRYRNPNYEGFAFAHPKVTSDPLKDEEWEKISVHFATRFSQSAVAASQGRPARPAFRVTPRDVQHVLPRFATRWGKFCIGGGNLMHAANMQSSHPLDKAARRDPTYIRYQLLVDLLAHRANAPSNFEPRPFFGQLLDIYEIRLPASPQLRHPRPETYILARIRPCNADRPAGAPAPSFGQHSHETATLDVIDISCVSSVVGRIFWNSHWCIVDPTEGELDSVIPEDTFVPE